MSVSDTDDDVVAHDPLRILLVEDSVGDRMSIERAFRRLDPSVAIITAESAEQALSLLEAPEPPDFGLCLLDINLPRMNGLTLLQRLKAASRLNDVPMLMLTTSEAPADVAAAFAAGADGYLVKPFDAKDYDRLVRFLQMAWHGEPFDQTEFKDLIILPPE